jgi:hypothetical protein
MRSTGRLLPLPERVPRLLRTIEGRPEQAVEACRAIATLIVDMSLLHLASFGIVLRLASRSDSPNPGAPIDSACYEELKCDEHFEFFQERAHGLCERILGCFPIGRRCGGIREANSKYRS